MVGGFGSLRTPDGQQYADRPDLPAQAAPEIIGQRDALTFYHGVTDLHWTYLSPPPGGIAPGERTGSYQLAVDTIGDRDPASTTIPWRTTPSPPSTSQNTPNTHTPASP